MKLKLVYFLGGLFVVSLMMCQSNFKDEVLEARADFVQDSILRQQLAEQDQRRKEDAWINKHLSKMSKSQKLGQLFMLGAYPDKGLSDIRKVYEAIDSHHIGGLIFFRGTSVAIAQQTNLYQNRSKVPLMMASVTMKPVIR